MKKKCVFSIVTFGLISGFLFSCGNGSSTNSSKEDDDIPASEVSKALKNIKEGYKLSGSGKLFEDEEADFSFEYTYLNKDEEGFSTKISLVYPDDPDDILIDETYFKDEDGNIYQESLGIDNVVKRDINMNYTYESAYINPFTLLNENDFYLESNGKYSVDTHKMSYVLDKVFYMNNKFVSAFMTIKDDKFVSFEVNAKEAFENNSYVSKVEGNFNYDNVKLNHVLPLEESDAQKKLTTALNSVGDAFVIDFINNKESEHQKIYMSGKSIFVQYDYSATEIDEWQDSWWNSVIGENGLIELYYMADIDAWGDNGNSYESYEEALPKFDIISGALFEYDEARDVFTLESEYADIVAGQFMPKMFYNAVGYKNNLTIEISLANDSLSNLHFFNKDCDIEMILSEFDGLPFNLKDEAVSI
ncbi:MAG: hypothetical protein J1F32_02255 [Erysipelotrichales bacterium]|nr:hypothetical protein [Erysipelotrichales bacterium]